MAPPVFDVKTVSHHTLRIISHCLRESMDGALHLSDNDNIRINRKECCPIEAVDDEENVAWPSTGISLLAYGIN